MFDDTPSSSSTDDDLEPPGDTAEIGLAGLLRDAALPQNAGDVSVFGIGRQADPAVQAEFGAAIDDPSRVARVNVVAGIRKREVSWYTTTNPRRLPRTAAPAGMSRNRYPAVTSIGVIVTVIGIPSG